MILAQHGTAVEEAVLEENAAKEPGGVSIEELARLAGHHGLRAQIEALHLPDIAALVSKGVFPIVYLNRVHIDQELRAARRVALRRSVVHAVVPVRISQRFVTFIDPRLGIARRISREKFDAAQRDLAHWCVVCKPG